MKKKHNFRIWAAVCLFVFAGIASLFPGTTAYAAGERYEWSSRTTIRITGGATASPGEISVREGYVPSGGFYLYKDDVRDCHVDITVEIDSNKKSGTITSAVATTYAAPQGDPYQYGNCSQSELGTINALKNTRITIQGDPNNNNETSGQRIIGVALYTNIPQKDAPNQVRFSLSKNGKVISQPDAKDWERDYGEYHYSFKNMDAGKYTVCVDTTGKIKKQCRDVTKVRAKALSVNFGKETSNGEIKVKVELNTSDIDDVAKDQTFGPFSIELRKGEDVLKTGEVTFRYVGTDNACGGGGTCIITLFANHTFENVKTGSYKVCHGDRCVDAKLTGVSTEVTLSLKDDDLVESNELEKGETSCNVEGVGWIVCPALTFVGTVNDAAYSAISSMLSVRPEIYNDKSDTRVAWEVFRNIANVAFIIAFILIIYSQITSVGISNYGIKRMLPKLIIAAILVNISYFVCQIAVDISNIIGGSIYDLFKSLPTSPGGTEAASNDLPLWKDVIGKVLALGVLLAAGLLLAFTLGGAALLAVGVVIIILLARQAALVLLIVISPLAFVAYLLPNLEDWFKKWWKIFSTLLLLFPVVGLIFGAGHLAARIVNGAGASGDQELLQLMALGISVVPLFALPIVMKAITSTFGALGSKLSGWQDRSFSGVANKGKERYKNSAWARGRALKQEGRQRRKDLNFANAASGRDTTLLGRARRRAALGLMGGQSLTRTGTAGVEHLETAALSHAIRAEDEEYEKGVKAAGVLQAGLSNRQVADITATGEVIDSNGARRAATEHELAAANDRIMKSGSFSERNAALSYLAKNKNSVSQTLRARAVQGAYARGDQNIYGEQFGNEIIEDTGAISSSEDLEKSAVANAGKGKVKAEHLAQSAGATKYLVNAVVDSGDTVARGNLRGTARQAQSNEQISGKLNREIIADFARLR